MAVVLINKDKVTNGIDFISLPSINLRYFCGDELRLVAQFSGHFPEANFCDIFVPKIDRSCFNESAGSRKQTYNNRGSSNKLSNRGLGQCASVAPVIHRRSGGLTSRSPIRSCDGEFRILTDEPAPNSRAISRSAKVVARLMSGRKERATTSGRQVVGEQTATNKLAWRGKCESEGGRTGDEGSSIEIFGSGKDLLCAESKNRKTRRATCLERAGECRSPMDVTSMAAEELATGSRVQRLLEGITAELISRKKLKQPLEFLNDTKAKAEKEITKRKRKRSYISSALGEDELAGAKRSRVSLRDRIGDSQLDSRQLESIRRPGRARIDGREGYMMELLAKMNGQWSSSERTLKIVNALGFPVGWTVRVGLRFKDGRTLLEYRDWRSPDGTLWPSFKGASASLLSSIGHDSARKIVVLLEPGGGIICEKGISFAKQEDTYETVSTCAENLIPISCKSVRMDSGKSHSVHLRENVDEADTGKGNLLGGFCSRQVCSRQRDPSLKGCPIVDNIPNITTPTIVVEATRYVDVFTNGEHKKQVLNEGDVYQSRQSTSYKPFLTSIGSLLRGCDHFTNTQNPSKEAGLTELPSELCLDSTSTRMASNGNSSRSISKEVKYCTRLMPCNESGHNCPARAMILSTTAGLGEHVRRAKPGRRVRCDVCGRHFSSLALLLGHRMKIGHPRVTRASASLRRVQAKGSEQVPKFQGSKMLNIVLGLLSDTSVDFGCKIGHASAAEKLIFKSTKNLKAGDILKVVSEEVRQDANKRVSLSERFECKICDKVFNRRSQYWGHLSTHSKQRKKTHKPDALLEQLIKRSSSSVFGSDSNLAVVVREKCGYEAGHKYVVESVFWRLLDGSLPLDGPNHEIDAWQYEEIIGHPALQAKEELISEVESHLSMAFI